MRRANHLRASFALLTFSGFFVYAACVGEGVQNVLVGCSEQSCPAVCALLSSVLADSAALKSSSCRCGVGRGRSRLVCVVQVFGPSWYWLLSLSLFSLFGRTWLN